MTMCNLIIQQIRQGGRNMSYLEEYQQKLTTAEEAVKVVQSGDWLDYGWSICSANALAECPLR